MNKQLLYAILAMLFIVSGAQGYNITSGKTSVEYTGLSFLDTLSNTDCDQLNASYTRGVAQFDVGSANCGYCCDWIYPYPSAPEDSQYVMSDRINFQPYIVIRSGNNVLTDGDTYCEGDILTVEQGINGSWFGDGGPVDCPAIDWVNKTEFERILNSYLSQHKNQYDDENIEINHSQDYYNGTPNTSGELYDPVSMMDTYYSTGVRNCIPEIYANIICNADPIVELPNNLSRLGWKEGVVQFNVSYSPKCAVLVPTPVGFYDVFSGPSFDYRAFVNPVGWDCPPEKYIAAKCEPLEYNKIDEIPWLDYIAATTTINLTAQITGIKESKLPVISVKGATINTDSSEPGRYMLNMIIENSGNATAFIDNISIYPDAYTILYSPKSLEAGNKSDVILETNDQNLASMEKPMDIHIYYHSEKVACPNQQNFVTEYKLSAIDVTTPSVSDQVYDDNVVGSCTNHYYSCYSPDEKGAFYAGYTCYNRDPYYVNVQRRVDLGYTLSRQDADILQAFIQINVLKVDRPQTLTVYAASDSWTPSNCVAGGDICTQPYCQECQALNELGQGKPISSTYIDKPGTYLLDVTDALKQIKGTSNVSFQIRGDEEVKESSADMPCGKFQEWADYGVTIDATQTKPLLKVVYTTSQSTWIEGKTT